VISIGLEITAFFLGFDSWFFRNVHPFIDGALTDKAQGQTLSNTVVIIKFPNPWEAGSPIFANGA